MFILNHIVLDVENNEVFLGNFVFETKEQAEKAQAELNRKYDLVKMPDRVEKVISDIRQVEMRSDNTDIVGYLNELNNLRLDLDDNYTDEEYTKTKEIVNAK